MTPFQSRLRGSVPALLTTLGRDLAVDGEAMRKSTRRLLDNGSRGVVVVGTSGVLWLYHASATGLSALQTALGVFAFAVAIPLMTPLLAHFRLKMIRPAWMITALPVQAAALIAIWWVPAWPWHLLPLGVMGIAASMVYYQCVYYANADEQTHTRSVSINEAALAIGSMTGPLALGLIAWEDRTAFRPYGVGAAVLVLAAVVAAMVWMRRDRTASA